MGNYMLTLKRTGCAVLLAAGVACSGSELASPTSPSPSTPSAPSPATATLSGQVTDRATSAPLAGARVVNGLRQTFTDSSGHFSITGILGLDTLVTLDGYDEDIRLVRTLTHDVRLHRVERITAGQSKVVTIAPDDTLCVNNMQDFPGPGSPICRTVHVLAPTAGVITLEARSTQSGELTGLEVEILGGSPCCSERLQNPTSIRAQAGAEVLANVEMAAGSATSQSFILTTSMAPQ